MNDFAKRVFTILLMTGLFAHFCFIYIFSTPYKIKSDKVNFASWYYVTPFFYQQWSLFAPTPKRHFALYVRCQSHQQWQGWTNLLQQKVNEHQRNVVAGNELYVLMYSSTLIYLVNVLKPQNTLFKEEPKEVMFQILKHEINNELINSNGLKKGTPFEILITSTENKQSTNYYFTNLVIQ